MISSYITIFPLTLGNGQLLVSVSAAPSFRFQSMSLHQL